MSAAAVVLVVAVVLIVLALVYYLVSTILALRRISAGLDEVIAGVGEIVDKSGPVNGVVTAINEQLDAGVELLEGLLVKKAGMRDAVGLIEGLYPGAAASGLRNFPESTEVDAPRIGEVYTKGTLTLALDARRDASLVPRAGAEDLEGGSLSARKLYRASSREPGESPGSPSSSRTPEQYGGATTSDPVAGASDGRP